MGKPPPFSFLKSKFIKFCIIKCFILFWMLHFSYQVLFDVTQYICHFRIIAFWKETHCILLDFVSIHHIVANFCRSSPDPFEDPESEACDVFVNELLCVGKGTIFSVIPFCLNHPFLESIQTTILKILIKTVIFLRTVNCFYIVRWLFLYCTLSPSANMVSCYRLLLFVRKTSTSCFLIY